MRAALAVQAHCLALVNPTGLTNMYLLPPHGLSILHMRSFVALLTCAVVTLAAVWDCLRWHANHRLAAFSFGWCAFLCMLLPTLPGQHESSGTRNHNGSRYQQHLNPS